MLRIGTLGAARTTPHSLIAPARALPDVSVTAVAARDRGRAAKFAQKHGIATVHASYDDLLADPQVDAVYNPLPNSLHAEWTLKALAAGKHVLCEKPFTSNEREARAVADAAAAAGLVVMEAFHYRYHPLADRMREICHDGRLGPITEISAQLCYPAVRRSDIRYNYELGGGSLMDGCYALHCVRLLGDGEPQIVSAKAEVRAPKVDRMMEAELRFPGGARGFVRTSLWSRHVLGVSAKVVGERGRMQVTNYVLPHAYHRLRVTVDGTTVKKRVTGEPTYTNQLRTFTAAVQEGKPTLTPPEDSVVTMRLIDAIYTAAGLPLRGL